jgi:hypothetical protein
VTAQQTPPPKPTRTGIVLGAAIGAVVAAPLTALILDNHLLGLGIGAVLGGCIGDPRTVRQPETPRRARLTTATGR